MFARYDWKPNVGIWLLFYTKLHVLWPRRTGHCRSGESAVVIKSSDVLHQPKTSGSIRGCPRAFAALLAGPSAPNSNKPGEYA